LVPADAVVFEAVFEPAFELAFDFGTDFDDAAVRFADFLVVVALVVLPAFVVVLTLVVALALVVVLALATLDGVGFVVLGFLAFFVAFVSLVAGAATATRFGFAGVAVG
jgi:hypothetical protein